MTNLPPTRSLKKLSEICVIERGGSPRPIVDFLTNDENGVNWIKIGDTKKQVKYINYTAEKIKPEGVKRSRMVYPGDFILSNSMSFGKPYIMQTTGCIHDGRLVLRPDETIDKDFMYHLLGSPFMYAKFEQTAAGTGVKNLNIQKVKVIKIPLPPLPIQLSIVSKLDSIHASISANKASIQEQLRKLDEMWESGLSEAFDKSEYTWVNLSEICTKITDGSHNPPKGVEVSEYKMISSRNVDNGVLSFEGCRFLTKEDFDLENKRTDVQIGDILLSIVGTIGKVCVVTESHGKFTMQRSLAVIKPKKDLVDSKFLGKFFQSPVLQKFINNNAKGAAQKGIYLGALKELQIPLPSLETQQTIVTHLDYLNTSISTLRDEYTQQLAHYDELRASALDQAFRGKLA